ncbi:MAG: MoaD/ThiS family protein [Desulfuromonadales bacterium]|nr:MoaD/ThiS family protein [Desulfuromonadales bacterium]
MQITTKLFASFRIGRFAAMPQSWPAGATVRQVVDQLGIPEGELGIVLINGRHVELGERLNEGDTLSLFPLVGGG